MILGFCHVRLYALLTLKPYSDKRIHIILYAYIRPFPYRALTETLSVRARRSGGARLSNEEVDEQGLRARTET